MTRRNEALVPRRTPKRSLADLATHPAVWVLVVGLLFALPLFKALGSRLPEPLPGIDTEPLAFSLPDDTGRMTSLASLAGRVAVLCELPMANATARDRAFAGVRGLRKRLRGLDPAIVFVMLCHGAEAASLERFVTERKARKPSNAFLLDQDRITVAWLRRTAGSELAEFFLADRHGRLRGLYGDTEPDIDRLVVDTGQLANWPGSDPAPEAVR